MGACVSRPDSCVGGKLKGSNKFRKKRGGRRRRKKSNSLHKIDEAFPLDNYNPTFQGTFSVFTFFFLGLLGVVI